MRRLVGLSLVIACSTAPCLGAASSHPASTPLILSVVPDMHGGSLAITGSDLHGYAESGRGRRDPVSVEPAVTLGGLVLPVESFTGTHIHARFPSLPLAAGTYLLTVAHDREGTSYASFPVTLGATQAREEAESASDSDPPIFSDSVHDIVERIEQKVDLLDMKVDAVSMEVVTVGMDVDALLVEMDTLVDAKAGTKIREFCIEVPGELHVSGDLGMDIEGEALAKVGAKVFGNGAVVRFLGKGLAEVRGGIAGGFGVSWTVCWDRTRPEDNPDVEGQDVMFEALNDTLTNLGILDRRTGEVNDARILKALDAMRDFDPNLSPASLLTGEETLFADIAPLLPIPKPFRAKLEDPRATFDATLSALLDALLNICETAGDYPPAMGDFLVDLCARIPTLTLSEVEAAFNELLGLRSDIEMAFDVCLNGSQSPFTIPAISSPSIPSHSIHIGFPIDETFTTFPGFSSQQLYAGDSVEVINVQDFVTCLGKQLP